MHPGPLILRNQPNESDTFAPIPFSRGLHRLAPWRKFPPRGGSVFCVCGCNCGSQISGKSVAFATLQKSLDDAAADVSHQPTLTGGGAIVGHGSGSKIHASRFLLVSPPANVFLVIFN